MFSSKNGRKPQFYMIFIQKIDILYEKTVKGHLLGNGSGQTAKRTAAGGCVKCMAPIYEFIMIYL
jgi:hypothetical protein